MKIKFKYLLLTLVLCVFIIHLASIVKCEVLTYQHYDEFKDAYKQNTMLGEMESFKVLKYEPQKEAKVYYISENKAMGNVLTFEYNGSWQMSSWDTGWSKSGNADNLVYPYWWHWVYFLL